MKERYKNKWWIRWIRSYNWFSFRYWWFNHLIWATLIALFIWLLMILKPFDNDMKLGKEINLLLRNIDMELENCCNCLTEKKIVDSIPRAPKENCRVHFAGTLISDHSHPHHLSEIYTEDAFSEYVGSGFYANNTSAFPKAVKSSFDGIAVDKGTRLIIYSKPNFEGIVLLDITGPAIINNIMFKTDAILGDFIHQRFKEPLETNYPQSCRNWSETNMRDWSYGSCKIICSK